MAWLQDFHFLRPWWLIGLFLPLLIYVIAYRQTAAQSAWRKVCDENLLEKFANDKKLPEKAEEHIILLKNNNKHISLNSLSIFNNFYSDSNKVFSVSYINSDKEIKAETLKINAEK